HMAENSEQRSQRRLFEGWNRLPVISHNVGQHHSRGSFRRVEQKRQPSQQGRFAGNIRRSDVSAAASAHIFPTEDTYKQVAEWNRSKQVTQCGNDEEG